MEPFFYLPFAFFLCPHTCVPTTAHQVGLLHHLAQFYQVAFVVLAWLLAVSLGCLSVGAVCVCFQVNTVVQSPHSSSTVITLGILLGVAIWISGLGCRVCGIVLSVVMRLFRWECLLAILIWYDCSVCGGAFSISEGPRPFWQA